MIHTFTHPRGHTHTHTERLAEDNCLGSSPARLHPPLSPGEGTSEQGSACWVGPVAERPVFEGGLWRGRVFGKGKRSAGSFKYQWKRLSLSATQGSRVTFLYLPPLSPPQRKDNVKETCNRNISRKGRPKQLQSYPRKGKMLAEYSA